MIDYKRIGQWIERHPIDYLSGGIPIEDTSAYMELIDSEHFRRLSDSLLNNIHEIRPDCGTGEVVSLALMVGLRIGLQAAYGIRCGHD